MGITASYDGISDIMETAIPLTRWDLSTKLYGDTSEKKGIFIAITVGTSGSSNVITFQVILIEHTDIVQTTTTSKKLLRSQKEM
jgi:hypothetical protein